MKRILSGFALVCASLSVNFGNCSDITVGTQVGSRYIIKDEFSFEAALSTRNWHEWMRPMASFAIQDFTIRPNLNGVRENGFRCYYAIDASVPSSIVLTTWRSESPTTESRQQSFEKTMVQVEKSLRELNRSEVKLAAIDFGDRTSTKLGCDIIAKDSTGKPVFHRLVVYFGDRVYCFQTFAHSLIDHEHNARLVDSFRLMDDESPRSTK